MSAQTAFHRPANAASTHARALREQMLGEILPFWLAKGWDARRGGFHERFFFDGTPDALTVRAVTTQFRQIDALARAAELGWRAGLKLAFQGLEYMIERAWGPDGAPGFAHILAPDGSAVETQRTASDHAAAISALATLSSVSGDAQVQGLLRLLMAFVENALHIGDGVLKPVETAEGSETRLDGYLDLMDALLSAHERVGAPKALERAARIRQLLESRIADPESGTLPGVVEARHFVLTPEQSFALVPAHQVRAAHLIRRYERLAGLAAMPFATHLLGAGLRASAPATGFLIESIDSHGTVIDSHTRLAPQSVLVQAWLAQAANGIEGARDAAEALLEKIMMRFLQPPFRGGWIDRLDSQGQPAIDTVPAASLRALVNLCVAVSPPEPQNAA